MNRQLSVVICDRPCVIHVKAAQTDAVEEAVSWMMKDGIIIVIDGGAIEVQVDNIVWRGLDYMIFVR